MTSDKQHEPSVSLFDAQAPEFDARAGLPEEAARRIARAVLELVRLPSGSVLVELGAGTGQIGAELYRSGVRYCGLDASPRMLAEFRARFAEKEAGPELLQADACSAWPVAQGSAGAVFGSRSLHFIPPEHIVEETLRIASAEGCTLLVGRVVRSRDSVRRKLRRELHRRLALAGFRPRKAEQHTRRLLELAVARGGGPLDATTVANFPRTRTLRECIEEWRSKSGLAGLDDLPESVRRAVLSETERWAYRALENADTPFTENEEYVLQGARFSSTLA